MSYRLIAILTGFVLLGVAYSAHTPRFEAPDEAAHFRYIDHLIEQRTLPRIEGSRAALFAAFNVEVHQPPLYYALAALPVQLWGRAALDGALRANPFAAVGAVTGNNENVLLHPPTPDVALGRAVWAARLVSLALGCVTVWAVWRAGVLAWGPGVGLGAALLVVSLPTFVHISASVNNDNVTNAVYAVGVMLALQMWTRRALTAGDVAALAVVLPAAALSKTTGLTLYGVVVGTLVLGALTGRWTWRRAGVAVLALVGASVVLAGWWYARNLALYGDPLAVDATARLWSRGRPTWPSWDELGGVWASFWMTLGHLNVAGPDWLPGYAAAVTALGVGGALWRAAREPETRWVTAFALLVCVLVVAALLVATRRVNVSQGRLLYPMLAAFAPLLVAGWRAVLGRRLFVLPVLPLAVVALAAPWTALAPAYRPLAVLDGPPADLRPLDVRAETITLHGYTLHTTRAAPGDTITLDVVFSGGHAENPSLFVTARHPVSGATLGAVDTYPGMAPTDTLDPNQLYRARVRFPLDAAPTATTPFQVQLAFGWRVPAPDDPTQGRFVDWFDAAGRPIGAVFGPGPVLVSAVYTPPPIVNPVDVAFGEGIRLHGYDVATDGDTTRVTLWWERGAPLTADWTLTVGLADADGALTAQDDGPLPGYPTSAWADAGVFTSAHLLAGDIPPGAALRVGWYAPGTFARLPAAGDVPIRDDLLFIPLE